MLTAIFLMTFGFYDIILAYCERGGRESYKYSELHLMVSANDILATLYISQL